MEIVTIVQENYEKISSKKVKIWKTILLNFMILSALSKVVPGNCCFTRSYPQLSGKALYKYRFCDYFGLFVGLTYMHIIHQSFIYMKSRK